MNDFTVIFDACVLHPASLRDLLMRLALTDLFRAKWTAEIHEEWISSVLRRFPNEAGLKDRLETTRDKMDSHVRDALVTGYEYLIPSISLSDPHDRHVVAAAIASGASAIVTFNLRHFRPEDLRPYNLEALHPDDFLVAQFGLAAPVVCATVKRHREALKKPPKSVEEYLDSLSWQGLPQTVSELRKYRDLI